MEKKKKIVENENENVYTAISHKLIHVKCAKEVESERARDHESQCECEELMPLTM